MKKLIPILLLCALLLFGCAKKDTAPEGSGSAGTETGQTAEKKDQPASKSAKTKNTPAPAKETDAAQTKAPQGSSGAKPTANPNPAVSAPTPTPKIEDWDDAEAAQQQILDMIKVNPVGNWIDNATGTMMVIDGEFRGSILLTNKDGSSSVWTFTGEYDPTSGVLSYTDGIKQTVGSGGMKTEYQNSAGSLAVKDGNLVWTDANESKTVTFVRDET